MDQLVFFDKNFDNCILTVSAIIMSPTRELALQTWKEANKFARNLNISVACVYGGVGISEQIAELKKGAEVIVCTPGRMIDMLAANNGGLPLLAKIISIKLMICKF